MTAPIPQRVKDILWARSGGRCEVCGVSLTNRAYSRHHRRRKGMGGSKVAWINSPANLLMICGTGVTDCHGQIEDQAREASYDLGRLLRYGEHPFETPVELTYGRVLLDDDGDYEPVPA